MNRISSKNPGVYVITNLVNGKVYVGSAAKSLRNRTRAHETLLMRGKHSNVYLQRAWNKYGAKSFIVSVLEECSSTTCVEKEQWWMGKLNAFGEGYNLCPTAGSRKGTKLSEETKELISKKKRGVSLSDETKRKMSESQVGRVCKEETKKKLSVNHWTKGPNAQDIKKRIAKGNTGAVFTEERKMNISRSRRRQLSRAFSSN